LPPALSRTDDETKLRALMGRDAAIWRERCVEDERVQL
jgi:hypothetical protein